MHHDGQLHVIPFITNVCSVLSSNASFRTFIALLFSITAALVRFLLVFVLLLLEIKWLVLNSGQLLRKQLGYRMLTARVTF